MNIFSFRAESLPDVSEFQKLCHAAGLALTWHEQPYISYPDTAVEVHTDASLQTLQGLMRRVEDGHVMLQTLRQCPLSENSFERDVDLK